MNKIIHKYIENHDFIYRYNTRTMNTEVILETIYQIYHEYNFTYELIFKDVFLIDIEKVIDTGICINDNIVLHY